MEKTLEQLQRQLVLDQNSISDFINSEEINPHELMISILENSIDPGAFQELNEIDQDAFLTEQAFRYGMAYGIGMLNEAIKRSLADVFQSSQIA